MSSAIQRTARSGHYQADALEIVEITDAAALEALRPEWQDIFEADAEADPFQSPEWLLAWQRTVLHDGLWTVAIRRAGRLLGLAPLFIYRRADGTRQVTLLGNGVSDRLDLVALPDARAIVAEAVFKHLADRADLWDSCDFRDLPTHSALLTTSLPLRTEDHVSADEPCPVVQLPDRPEDVHALLPPKRRADLQRCARRAAEAGAITYQIAEQGDCPRRFAEFLQVHDARWRIRREEDALADGVVKRFACEAAHGLMQRSLLRLCVMRLDGRPVAAQYGLQRMGRGYSYSTAFDPAFARFSPGLLLTAFMLEQAVRERATTFDFLRGREPYKYLWGAVDRPQYRRRIVR